MNGQLADNDLLAEHYDCGTEEPIERRRKRRRQFRMALIALAVLVLLFILVKGLL